MGVGGAIGKVCADLTGGGLSVVDPCRGPPEPPGRAAISPKPTRERFSNVCEVVGQAFTQSPPELPIML